MGASASSKKSKRTSQFEKNNIPDLDILFSALSTSIEIAQSISAFLQRLKLNSYQIPSDFSDPDTYSFVKRIEDMPNRIDSIISVLAQNLETVQTQKSLFLKSVASSTELKKNVQAIDHNTRILENMLTLMKSCKQMSEEASDRIEFVRLTDSMDTVDEN
jgi:hypothetical protein